MTLIVPILQYASETWTSTKAELNHLQAFHMRCQRRIFGVRWFHKIKNANISRRTGLPHIGDLIQKRRHALLVTLSAWTQTPQPMYPSSSAGI